MTHELFATYVVSGAEFFAALIVSSVSIYVYFYTRRRDKLDFYYRAWNEQFILNVEALKDSSIAMASENLILGENSDDALKTKWSAFIIINRLQHEYEAYRRGLVPYREYLKSVLPSVMLYQKSRDYILELIKSRGYSSEFYEEVVSLFEYDCDIEVNEKLVDAIYSPFEQFFKSRLFSILSYGFIINPILLGVQLFKILSTGSSEGVSIITFIGFAFLNLLAAVAGVKAKNLPMIFSFLVSFIISISIVIYSTIH